MTAAALTARVVGLICVKAGCCGGPQACDVNALSPALLAMLGLTAGTGGAEPVESLTDAEVTVPETIVVVGKRERPLSRVAARVTVLHAEDLALTLSTDIRDAVRYEPGLTVPGDPIRFGLDSFSIRGMGGNRVAGEVDGIPVPDSFVVGSFANSGRTFIELDFVDRLELLRGPASSLYGSDAIAGVVAFDTLDPADLARTASRTAEAHLDYRSQDGGRSATGLVAARGADAEILGGLVHRTARATDIAGPTQPNPRDYEATSAIAKLIVPDAAGGSVEFTITGDREVSRTDVQALLGQPGRFANTVAMQAEDVNQRFRLSAEQLLRRLPMLESVLWRLYIQGSRVMQDTDEQRAAAPPRFADPLAIERGFRFDTRSWGGEITATSQSPLGDWRHEFVYGVEIESTRIEETRTALATDLATQATTNVVLGESFPLRDFPRTDLREIGIFVQDDARSGADRWSVIPALRLDYYELEPQPDALYSGDAAGGNAVGVDTWSVSPKLGVIRRIRPDLSVFAQYARGFRAPPFADVNIGLEIPLFNVRAIPNPDLEAETSDGYELGVRAHGRGWWLEASAWYTDFSNFIESRVNLGPDPGSGVVLFQSRNVADARIYGLEASLATSLERRPPGWSMRASLAWSRGDDLTHDTPLNPVDPAKAVLAAAYGSASGRWGAELVLTAVDRKRRLDRSHVDLYAPDGYATLDLLGHVRVSDGVSMHVALLNVTDERYQQWADVGGRAGDDPLLPFYGQPGRSISVNVTWAL